MCADIVPRPRSHSTESWDPDNLADIDEFEDTEPSVFLPSEEEFTDAPTVPGFRLRSGAGEYGGSPSTRDDGHWERTLRTVAQAVKRVFASHSIS
ncbi:MAG TPA: hypothetical protein VMI54_09805 [Polyangiaceae bacterium]|nr:hypothetical protein [Polyangiaceae bacterium]